MAALYSVEWVRRRCHSGIGGSANQAPSTEHLQYRMLVEHSGDLLWSITPRGIITYVSPSWLRETGYRAEQAVGRSFDWMIHDDDLPTCMEYVARFNAGLESAEIPEYRLRHADGSIRWHVARVQAVRDAAGRLISMVGVSRDITEKKRMHELLCQSERRFRSIFEQTPAIAVQGYDRQRKVIFWNHASEALYGYSAAEANGRQLEDLIIPEEMRDQVIGTVDSWIRENASMPSAELALKRKDGSRVDVFSSHLMLRNTEGDPEMYCIDVDLTERKRIEDALRKANGELREAIERANQMAEEARQANLSKSEFLANMSHEIRTPMTAILGFADLLNGERDLVSDPEMVADCVRRIRANADHLMSVINDVLDMSKIEAGKLSVEMMMVDLGQVMDAVVAALENRAAAKGLELGVEYDSMVPDRIRTDPVRLRQILFNLVGNAIKFSDRGAILIRASFAQQSPGAGVLRLAVVDSGIGMTPEQCRRISRFKPFTQADGSTSRRFGGTGLGLSISSSLAQLLGGRIEVASEEGRGSRFTLVLETEACGSWQSASDRDDFDVRSIHHPEPTACDRSAAVSLAGARILLVEDGVDNQRLVGFHLGRAGASVATAEHGRAALEAIERAGREGRPFDLVLMDMQMPVMDGYEATRQLRSAGFQTPIIALTAHAMVEDRKRCLETGCNDYASKPIDPVGLLRVCGDWIRKCAATSPIRQSA
ncbi:MAG: PAS domain S-box protein [Phycisphaeraceae bacterium]|nr:PAS domain S-box protein [Phycisphaeraceae bacterium]